MSECENAERFDFQHAKLVESRKILSLSLFDQLIERDIDTSEFVSRFREIFTSSTHTDLSRRLFRQLTTKVAETKVLHFFDFIQPKTFLIINIIFINQEIRQD